MRKPIGVLLVLFVAACGGGSDDAGVDYRDPASIADCDQLVDAGIALLQDLMDEVEGLEPVALEADPPPQAFIDVEEDRGALKDRAEELDCSIQEIDTGLVDRIGELEVADDNVLGSFIVEAVSSGPEPGFFRG
jgi:hypothetical protein